MSINLSSMSISGIYLGSVSVNAIYLGTTAIYSGVPADTYAAGGFSPALVFDFVNEYYRTGGAVSTFDTAMTHARSGNATMVDSDGLLKWAPHNLLTYSEDFSNAAWSSSSSAGAASNGTLTLSSSEGYAYLRQDVMILNVENTIKFTITSDSTISDVPFRAAAANGSASASTLIDLSAGIPQTVSFTLSNPTSAGVVFGLDARDVIVAGGSNETGYVITVSQPHVYRSDLGGMVDNPDRGDSYVPTTSAARYLARRGNHVYNGTSWVNAGVLIESEARTNLVTYSNDFTDGSWNKARTSVTLDATGPDGVSNSATTFSDNSSGGTGTVSMANNVTVATSTAYTASVFAKADQLSKLRFNITNFTTPANGGTDFDLSSGIITLNNPNLDSENIEDCGNGWYRCSVTFTTDAADTTGSITFYPALADGSLSVPLDGTSSILIYGAQLEAGSTPSSYIPTSGPTVKRAADTLTAPSANLPWPTPNVIGPELIASDLSTIFVDVSEITATATDLVFNTTTQNQITASISGGVVGKMYQVDFEVYDVVTGGLNLRFGSASANDAASLTAGGYSYSLYLDTTAYISFRASASTTELKVKNISVREIDPLAVSIQMDGRMTYADTDSVAGVSLYNWYVDAQNLLQSTIRTSTDPIGLRFTQANAGAFDTSILAPSPYQPGVNTPFNIASRHGSTFVNGAVDGTALTANTTPTALPDLSATDLDLATTFMGNIGKFRIWADDLSDAGIEEASA